MKINLLKLFVVSFLFIAISCNHEDFDTVEPHSGSATAFVDCEVDILVKDIFFNIMNSNSTILN